MSETTEAVVTETTSAAPAAETISAAAPAETAAPSATGATGDAGPSQDDVRAEQAAVLKAFRSRDAGEGEKKPDRTRAPDGKFAKAEKPEVESEAQPEKSERPAAEVKDAKAPAVEAPGYVAAPLKAVWGTLPEEARKHIDGMAKAQRDAAARYGNAERDFVKPFGSMLQKHADYFQGVKEHPAAHLDNMVAWDRAMTRDPVANVPKFIGSFQPSKAEVQAIISSLTETYKLGSPLAQNGIDPTFGEDPMANPAVVALQASYDSSQREIAAMRQRYEALEASINQRLEREEQARTQSVRAAEDTQIDGLITAFQSKQDPAEWDFLRPYLAVELQAMSKDVSMDKALPLAWDAAKKKFESVVGARMTAAEKARTEAAKKAAEAAKRAGAISIEGTPSAAPAAMSIRDEQRAALARARSANGASAF